MEHITCFMAPQILLSYRLSQLTELQKNYMTALPKQKLPKSVASLLHKLSISSNRAQNLTAYIIVLNIS